MNREHLGFNWLAAAVVLSAGLALAPLAAGQKARSGNVDNGKKLFATVGCAACHGERAEGGTLGPQISPPPLQQPQFTAYVRQPTGMMSAFSKDAISDAQLADVYAFLIALAKAPTPGSAPAAAAEKSAGPEGAKGATVDEAAGNADNGKKLYTADGCYECHGRDGQGGAAGPAVAGPPPLNLQGMIVYVRHPTGQMPPFTAKVLSDQEMADIYAFLKSIPKTTPSKDIPLLNQ